MQPMEVGEKVDACVSMAFEVAGLETDAHADGTM